MGKSKMDDAAAERIRRARGDRDGFSKRAADAAKRNEQVYIQGGSSSKSGSGSGSGGSGGGGHSKSGHKSGGNKK